MPPRMIVCEKGDQQHCNIGVENQSSSSVSNDRDDNGGEQKKNRNDEYERENEGQDDEEEKDRVEQHQTEDPTSASTQSDDPEAAALLAEKLSEELHIVNPTSSLTAAASKESPYSEPPPTTPPEPPSPHAFYEEQGALSPKYVGRVIGKGGEMIRDLQARSGCHIDVHQDGTNANSPRIVTYRGRSKEDVELAKRLVDMICEGVDEPRQQAVQLPLGKATLRTVRVPKSSIGKIIGRGGEMIRELQCRSSARIQVDHTTGGMEGEYTRVTITGTRHAVDAAERMIAFLCANPSVDGRALVRDRHWSDEIASTMPPHLPPAAGDGSDHFRQHGVNVGGTTYWLPQANAMGYPAVASVAGGGVGSLSIPTHSHSTSWDSSPAGYANNDHQQQVSYGPIGPHQYVIPLPLIETDTIPCAKMDIGHIIGKRGLTINDIQSRTSCDIQIDQVNCQIEITGPRSGIEMAKQMLREIIDRGSNHSFAGGQRDTLGGPQLVAGSEGYYGVVSPPPTPPHQIYHSPPHEPAMMMYHQEQAPPPPPPSYPPPWKAVTATGGQIYYYDHEATDEKEKEDGKKPPGTEE